MVGGMWVERRGLGQVGLRALRASEREGAPLDRFFLGVPSRGGREPTQPRAQGPGPRAQAPGSPGGLLSQSEEEPLGLAVRADVHKAAPEDLAAPGALCPGGRSRLGGGAEGVLGGTPPPPPRTASTPRTGFVLWAPGARARSFWPGETSRPLQFGARAGRPPRHQVRGMKPP